MAWSDGTLRFAYTELSELEDVARMLASERVCEHVFFGPNTPEETDGYFRPLVEPMQEALARGEQPSSHMFTIRRESDGAFIGDCALVRVEYGAGNYLIGYQLDEPWWRRGYGRRACEFLIWFGFSALNAHRLSADCLASNSGSVRILETCGFEREGLQRRYYNSRGRLHDNVLFGLLRDDVTLDLEALGRSFSP